jgi:hypothetical protein
MLILIWAAIASGFGYDMYNLNALGKLHFSLIVHIHAAAFTGWLVLFTAQILLIRSKNLALHKKMGLISFGLIPLMVIFGILTAFIVAKRDYGTPNSNLHFICVQLGNLILFSSFAGVGIYLRKNYAVHKRLMLLSTLALTEPGFARWFSFKIAPFFGDYFWNSKTFSQGFMPFWISEVLPQLILIIAIGVYDFVTRKQLNKAYVWGVLFFLLVTSMEVFLYYNETWFNLMKQMIGVA